MPGCENTTCMYVSGTCTKKTNSWHFSGIFLHLYVFFPAWQPQKSQTFNTTVHG